MLWPKSEASYSCPRAATVALRVLPQWRYACCHSGATRAATVALRVLPQWRYDTIADSADAQIDVVVADFWETTTTTILDHGA